MNRLSAYALFLGTLAYCAPNVAGEITINVPPLRVFDCAEFSLGFSGAAADLNSFDDTQVHDAYDADRDGRFIRVEATFSDEQKHSIMRPAFALRRRANARWEWCVRWMPLAPGRYSIEVHADAGFGKDKPPRAFTQRLDNLNVIASTRMDGPLVMPRGDEDSRFLRALSNDGGRHAQWLFGACRAWVSENKIGPDKWTADQWIDRRELFKSLRESGYNLLNQWMAPWEFALVHYDRAEHWRDEKGQWERVPLPKNAAWAPHQCLDQGRAEAFDRLVKMAEGGDGEATLYLLLAPIAHDALLTQLHPWNHHESGWSPADNPGMKPETVNGFSAFRPELSAWDFFEADPHQPLDDWRAKLFDHQANFYRYLIARWGASRALGAWVLIDEIDGVGDAAGNMKERQGWWAHPACDAWLANMFRLFHGELKRSDGLLYMGDAYGHPLSAASTSHAGQAERGGNIDWPGPAGAPPDLCGWHWYPSWDETFNWGDVFAYTVAGVRSYSLAPLSKGPRLITEFGAPDRAAPSDVPSALYPTMYHVGIWSAIFSGHAGTPMDWDDGKEFGELRCHPTPGIFDAQHYPIDNAAELRALRKFLGSMRPDEWTSGRIICSGATERVQVCALHSRASPDSVCGWLFSMQRDAPFTVAGLKAGTYRIEWFDPWTGEALNDVPAEEIVAQDSVVVSVNALPALKAMRVGLKKYPAESRLAKGHDVAFRLVPKSP